MKKKYSISEQFIIKYYNFFKFQTKAQQRLLMDKELAKGIVESLEKG